MFVEVSDTKLMSFKQKFEFKSIVRKNHKRLIDSKSVRTCTLSSPEIEIMAKNIQLVDWTYLSELCTSLAILRIPYKAAIVALFESLRGCSSDSHCQTEKTCHSKIWLYSPRLCGRIINLNVWHANWNEFSQIHKTTLSQNPAKTLW